MEITKMICRAVGRAVIYAVAVAVAGLAAAGGVILMDFAFTKIFAAI